MKLSLDFFKTFFPGSSESSWRVPAAAFFWGASLRRSCPGGVARCGGGCLRHAWQLNPSEYLIMFYCLGWLAEAALLGAVLGALVHLVRIYVRPR